MEKAERIFGKNRRRNPWKNFSKQCRIMYHNFLGRTFVVKFFGICAKVATWGVKNSKHISGGNLVIVSGKVFRVIPMQIIEGSSGELSEANSRAGSDWVSYI